MDLVATSQHGDGNPHQVLVSGVDVGQRLPVEPELSDAHGGLCDLEAARAHIDRIGPEQRQAEGDKADGAGLDRLEEVHAQQMFVVPHRQGGNPTIAPVVIHMQVIVPSMEEPGPVLNAEAVEADALRELDD